MKRSKLVLMVLGFSLFGLGQGPPLKGYPIFNKEDHVSDEFGKRIVYKKGRSYLYVSYDFNKNDKPDVMAIYNLFGSNLFDSLDRDSALYLYIGLEDKKAPSYCLVDYDGNETLETFVKGKEIREELKERNKPAGIEA